MGTEVHYVGKVYWASAHTMRMVTVTSITYPGTYEVPNDFAEEACRVLRPGVNYLVRNGRPPPGRDDEQDRQGGGRNVRGRQ